ncbi:MAG TPA: hypothetical protein PLT20_09875 [Sedimentisphaerales bacterium]|nr:hypothetical protein [Sedimentisphaerales bacterium]
MSRQPAGHAGHCCTTANRKKQSTAAACFKPTTRGTVATLCDTKIYDINETPRGHLGGHPATNEGPTPDHQATTNKNDKNEKNEKKEKAKLLWELLSQ